MASTLPIWASIIIFGVILAAFFGYMNPYVPKDQKLKARRAKYSDEGEDNSITYRIRLDGFFYVLVSTFVAIAATVAFVFEDFSNFAKGLGGGVAGKILAIVFMFFGLFVVDLFTLAVECVSEDLAVADAKKYYQKRYGVKLLFYKDLLK